MNLATDRKIAKGEICTIMMRLEGAQNYDFFFLLSNDGSINLCRNGGDLFIGKTNEDLFEIVMEQFPEEILQYVNRCCRDPEGDDRLKFLIILKTEIEEFAIECIGCFPPDSFLSFVDHAFRVTEPWYRRALMNVVKNMVE